MKSILLWMKGVLLAWDNSCDRCKRAVMVTTVTFPALGTHTHRHAQCTHTALGSQGRRHRSAAPPGHPLISCWGQGAAWGAGRRGRVRPLTWGMARAGVASLVALPGIGATGNVLLPQPTLTRWSCSALLLGGAAGPGLWDRPTAVKCRQ